MKYQIIFIMLVAMLALSLALPLDDSIIGIDESKDSDNPQDPKSVFLKAKLLKKLLLLKG
uniref:Uncharacterized protein n=1 Tax=Rhodnius prolixus TaxID=13249 RepID=T1I9R6_RHOPR